MKRHEVTCRACGEVMGYCWATDDTLKDWDAFYYTQQKKGGRWYGCMTPHVSRITGQLCLECCCGEDTRDFRANTKLPTKIIDDIEKRNCVGREFNGPDSKFLTRVVKKDTMIFKEAKNG